MAYFLQTLSRTVKHWYIPLIIGLLFVLMGVYIFTVPLAAYLALATFFSVTFIIAGLLEVFFAVQNSRVIQGWGWHLVTGLLTFVIGVYLVARPDLSALVLSYVVGFTILFRSFQLLGFAFDLRYWRVPNWGWVAATSGLGIILSVLLLLNPVFTGLSLVVFTALSIILLGLSSVAFSVALLKIKRKSRIVSKEAREKLDDLRKELRDFFR